ncbi:hypothetical protein F4809DRAFT_605928 [Biscogniauxia mediterranea]|nr:hypothetical protein F4809DRAFT_605928 [Biscogniauxia mediterranea]
MMEPKNVAQLIVEGREPQRAQRRASFSPMKAIRSFSISSQASQISSISDTEISTSITGRRGLLRKSRPRGTFREDLIRKPSKSSAEDTIDRASTSTRPTTPSVAGSLGTSISGDFAGVIKAGPLQPETSIIKPKKEFLVLTPTALVKFKNFNAATSQFPQILSPKSTSECLSPVETQGSAREIESRAEAYVPLEQIVSVFKDEGTRPSFGIEVWWSGSSSFICLQLDFSLPDDRDDWLRQIRQATKLRGRLLLDDRTPTDIEVDLKLILEAKHRHQKDTQIDIYPVIPRRPYTRLRSNSEEVKKNWRDSSSFYLAFSKNSILLAQFTRSPTGQKVNPSLVQFGLVTLSRVHTQVNDERFDLVFRLPLDEPKKLALSSRYHRIILSKLFKADAYLKPAWPLWTRCEVFLVDGEALQTPLPNGEDYGGFKTTLDAFLEGYHCPSVNWKVEWKNVQHPPQFRLLQPKIQSQYTAHQLLAVLRALRFNDYFKSLSFQDIDFQNLFGVVDNAKRLESTVWLSRTGKQNLTRTEFELVENSSIMFQEMVSLLLGSESVRHIDVSNISNGTHAKLESGNATQASSSASGVCDIIPPLVLLWRSSQTRCSSINLSGNRLSEADVVEMCRTFQNRPNFLKSLNLSRCNIDDNGLIHLWEGLHEQSSSLEVLDISNNPGCIEAARVSHTLHEAVRLKSLNLAYSLKGDISGPLLCPWNSTASFGPWQLEELDLSGWKINFDTTCGIMKYIELDESRGLRRLGLSNCGLTGEMATGILCRLGSGRDIHLFLNENPLEVASTDWIDLIHGNEAPRRMHLDMIQFQNEVNFNRLLKALSHNQTIEFLSMVGTGPQARAGSKTAGLLSQLFESNKTLKSLDISGYSGKLEDGHLGWGISDALSGLERNTSLRQLCVRNHDMGAADDVTRLCHVLAANKGLAMFDCRNNNFDRHQFAKLVHALTFNHQLISFPTTDVDREFAVKKERALFLKDVDKPRKLSSGKISKSTENRLEGLLAEIRSHWDSEAKKAQQVLARNREAAIHQLLKFEGGEAGEAGDDNLPAWLAPSTNALVRQDDKALQQPIKQTAVSLPALSNPCNKDQGPNTASHNPYSSDLPTYSIEEESSLPVVDMGETFFESTVWLKYQNLTTGPTEPLARH